MIPVSYGRASDVGEALEALADPGTSVLAGGTELVNWLKDGIVSPARLLDIRQLPLRGIDAGGENLVLGALERMSDVADHPEVASRFPVISEALLAGASPQLRTMATAGGNLMQRTRCAYFRADRELPCNKRTPGSGCGAQDADTPDQAIFGASRFCTATHPSDFAVALAALDAMVHLRSASGSRTVPLPEFYVLPGETPQHDTSLAADELITAIEIPPPAGGSHYLKVRQRASYEFAVVSAAADVALTPGTPVITRARIALGGVAAKPWRLTAAEEALPGRDITDTGGLREAIAASFGEARPSAATGYKVELAQRAAMRALRAAGGIR